MVIKVNNNLIPINILALNDLNKNTEDNILMRIASLFTSNYFNSTASYIAEFMFGYCNSLTSVTFTNCQQISSSAFYSCRNLSVALFPSCISIG